MLPGSSEVQCLFSDNSCHHLSSSREYHICKPHVLLIDRPSCGLPSYVDAKIVYMHGLKYKHMPALRRRTTASCMPVMESVLAGGASLQGRCL